MQKTELSSFFLVKKARKFGRFAEKLYLCRYKKEGFK